MRTTGRLLLHWMQTGPLRSRSKQLWPLKQAHTAEHLRLDAFSSSTSKRYETIERQVGRQVECALDG